MGTGATDRPITEVMGAIAEYAIAIGQVNLSAQPGCVQLPDAGAYQVWVNPHPEANETTDGLPVPPWSALFLRGGLPAALVDPFGGTTVGDVEDDIIAALRAATDASGPAR